MALSRHTLEQNLLATSAGRAVFDSLVQANVNLHTVPLDLVKDMLVSETRQRKRLGWREESACVPA